MKYSDFLKKYDNKGIEDWGTANSDDMKNILEEILRLMRLERISIADEEINR